MKWFEFAKIGETSCNDHTFSYLKLKEKFELEKLDCPGDAWLVTYFKDSDQFWLDFAVMEFSSQICGEDEIELTVLFHGCGPTNGLQECRHTYWGREGYIFYPNGPTIAAAFKALSKYYDDMA